MSSADSTATPLPDSLEEPELPRMSFLEHLEELRKRLLYSVIALAVGFLLSWNFAPEIFDLLQRPVMRHLPPGDKLAYTRMTAPFFLYMKVAFFTSIFLSAPVILYQLWLFISPGLYPKERRYAVPFIFFATLFFLAGGYFGFTFLLPTTCKFFVETGKNFKQMITVDDYLGFSSTLILAAGVIFETPILIFFLARLGVVTPAFLIQKFRYAVLLSFVISAIVTPTPDMITQTALALPMIVLYLIGIVIAKLFGKRFD
ncbi:MAG TPA: twin-arginine translocase subunit TatC [Thermoanaerobaculia bacterium]|nr:twin-arginine translocase subunit TatC [Thermoanaerobaculia bacterium]